MPSLGESLRAARERRGVSIDQAAEATKIRRRYLVALERDDLAALPGGTYRRVFVRTYSAYLGLDPEEMATLLPVPAARPPAGAEFERPAPLVRPPRAIATILIGVVSVLAICGIVLALQLRRSGSNESVAVAGGVTLLTPTPAAASTADVATPAPEAATPSSGAVKAIQIQATAADAVWVAVEADGHQLFAGSLAKGQSRTWDAATRLGLRAADGSRLSIALNGHDKGALNKTTDTVDASWSLDAQGTVVLQVAAATPQPTRTPPARSAPTPTR
jgi:cytoskeletal protein RodZ